MNQNFQMGRRAMRLALCATVVGAALTPLTSHAVVIAVDFSSNPSHTVPSNIEGTYLNVVTGAATAAFSANYDINPYFSGSTAPPAVFRLFTPPTTGGVVGTTIATPLALGAVVGVASTFNGGVYNANAAAPGTNYFGFKFLNEATGMTNYGYLVVAQTAVVPVAGSVRVLGYAYENAGTAITVVPEPATYLMFAAALAAGIGRRAWQVRRTA